MGDAKSLPARIVALDAGNDFLPQRRDHAVDQAAEEVVHAACSRVRPIWRKTGAICVAMASIRMSLEQSILEAARRPGEGELQQREHQVEPKARRDRWRGRIAPRSGRENPLPLASPQTSGVPPDIAAGRPSRVLNRIAEMHELPVEDGRDPPVSFEEVAEPVVAMHHRRSPGRRGRWRAAHKSAMRHEQGAASIAGERASQSSICRWALSSVTPSPHFASSVAPPVKAMQGCKRANEQSAASESRRAPSNACPCRREGRVALDLLAEEEKETARM